MAVRIAPFDIGQRAPQINAASAIRPHPVAKNTIDGGPERLVRMMDTAAGDAFMVASGEKQGNDLPS